MVACRAGQIGGKACYKPGQKKNSGGVSLGTKDGKAAGGEWTRTEEFGCLCVCLLRTLHF